MRIVKVIDNQTLLDFAISWYGTAEAVWEITQLNPVLENDPYAMVEAGITPGDFYFDIKLRPDMDVIINDNSNLMRKSVLRNINEEVTTYTTKSWQERLSK